MSNVSCKNCFNYSLCNNQWQATSPSGFTMPNLCTMEINGEKYICKDFKEKSKVVEMPCKIGSIVYILEYDNDEAVDYIGYIFLMANEDFALLSPAINGERNPTELCNYYFDNFAENREEARGVVIVPIGELFFSKEEVKKVLQSRSK